MVPPSPSLWAPLDDGVIRSAVWTPAEQYARAVRNPNPLPFYENSISIEKLLKRFFI